MSNELDNPLLTPVNPGDVQVIQGGRGPAPLPPLPGVLGMGEGLWNNYAEVVPPAQGIDPNAPTQLAPTLDENGALAVTTPPVTPEVPDAPVFVDKKVGQQTNSTTTQDQSQATVDALAQKDQAVSSEKDAIQKKAESDIAVSKKEAERDKMESGLMETVYNAHASAAQELIQKVNDDIAKRDAMAAELSNQKPETFWGSKSAADKISAALSVGLGAYGQALLGSGQNVGMVLLQRNMDEYQTIQKQRYDAKVKQIETMNTSIDNKANMIGKLDHMYDAQVLAGKEKVRGMYAQVLQEAKTPGVQAAAQKAAGEIDAQAAQFKAETAAKYEAKHTSTLEKDVMEKIQATAGVTKDGKPMSEFQGKSAFFFTQMKGAQNNLKQLDEVGITNRPALAEAIRKARADAALYDTTAFGVSSGKMQKFSDTAEGKLAEDILKAKDPEAYNYLQQTKPFINGILRSESGAAISDPEFQRAYEQYFPQPGDGPKEVEQKRIRRQEATRSMFSLTNLALEPK